MKTKIILLFLILICTSSLIISQVTHTVQFNPISIGNKEGEDRAMYAHLEMPAAMYADEAGNPELPAYYINYIIPPETKVIGFTITGSTTTSHQLNYPIYPAQLPIPCGLDCDPVPFVSPNPAIYNSANAYPLEMLSVQHQGYLDGANNIVQIKVVPFQYSPLTNQISFYSSITFDLILEQGFSNGIIYQRNRISKNQPIYDEALINLVSNPEDIPLYATPPTIIEQITQNGPLPYYEYVIVTKPEFFPAFDEFIDWKSKKGIQVGLVSINDIAQQYSGDLIFPGHEIIHEHWSPNQAHAGKLRQYLHDAYIEGTSWVLLAGDVSVLPARFGTPYDTNSDTLNWSLIIEADTYFADFTGNWNVDRDKYFGEPTHDSPDYFPEVFLGRLICSSPDDIQNWVTKVLKYEQNPGNGDFAYLTKSFMTEADEFQRDEQANAVMPHLPTFSHTLWGEDSSYYHPNPHWPKGADVVTQLNTTYYGLMANFNHGGSGGGNSGIATANRNINSDLPVPGPQYKLDAEEDRDFHAAMPEDGDGLDNLLNYDHPFITYSLSCVQNPFHLTKAVANEGARNFGESFTVNKLTGGVAFLGTTRSAEPDFTFHMFKRFGDLISSTENQYATHLGVAESVSKMLNFSHHYTAYSHTLIGCPETRIWTQTPVHFQAELSKPYAKFNETNDLAVTILNLPNGKDAIVSLYKQGELLLAQLVTGNANNTAIAQFNQFDLQSEGELFVTITSQNYIPYQEIVPVAFVVDTDQTWTSDVTIDSDVLIAECAVLTIECTVSMGAEKKIMITQCSQIIIDDGAITSITDDPWQGIQVWGNKNASQLALPGQPNPQGKLTLINGATIENARNAVTLWKPDDWNTTGGIVQADGSNFLNNRRSVEFLSYQNTNPVNGTPMGNASYFKNCHFEANDEYIIDDSPFNCHISMYNVDGINLTANSFLNLMTEGGNSGAGIGSINAHYRVVAGCSSSMAPCPPNDLLPNHFEGFAYGIDASSTTSKTIYVRQAEFANNGYGIRLNALNNATIIQNNFSVGTYGKGEWMCGTDFGIGIELAGCNNYAVEENTFTPVAPLSAIPFMGIRVYNNDDENVERNEIYFNSFDQMSRANQADGINYIVGQEYFGLNYRCNQNTGNFFDFVVTDRGIAGYQTSQQYAADNTFTAIPTTPPDPRHFFNDAINPITYYFRPGMANGQPLYVYNVTPSPLGTLPPTTCQSNFGGGSNEIDPKGLTAEQKQYFEQEMAESQTAYAGVEGLYNSLIDGGNTEAVQAEIAMAWPEDMWELRAELLDISPLLSKEVLVSASDRTDVLPESIIFEVLAANPDELKKKELMEHLENKDNPLPGYMIEILESLTGNVTYKTILQSQMAHYGRLEGRAAGILLRDMLRDSTVAPETIRAFMADRQSLPMDLQRVDSYMESGETAQALALAATLQQQYGLDGEALAEHGRFVQLKQLQADLHNQGRNIFQLSLTEKAQLEGLAGESTGLAGRQARSILAFVYDEEFCDCPADINPELKAREFTQPPLNKLDEAQISVRPNPAKTWVSFDYTIPEGSSNALLEIRDSGGKLVYQATLDNKLYQHIWDTRNMAPGLYHFAMKTTNGIKSGKVTIVK